MAVQEAIKRGIIHSEQDLFAKEFQEVSVKKSIFPDVDDDANKKKITKSIARAFLISGIIPAVYGFVKINDGAFIEGIILSAGGFLWVFLAAQLLRNASLKIIHSLFILVLISAVYVTKLIFSVPIVFIDIFIPVVIYILMVYGLLFLRRLI